MSEQETAQETKETKVENSLSADELLSQLEEERELNKGLRSDISQLKEQISQHGKEMKQKKERERAAIAEKEKLLADQGKYEEAIKLHEQRVADWEQERADFASYRKQNNLKMKLMEPGIINPNVNVEDVLPLIKGVEFDDNYEIVNWDPVYESLLKDRESWLKPTGNGQAVRKPSGDTGPVGEQGRTTYSSEARMVQDNMQILSGTSMPLESIEKLLKDEKIRADWTRRGWLAPGLDMNRYRKT